MRIFLYRLQFILVISNAEGSTLFVYLFMFLCNSNLSFNLIVLLISQWSRTYWLLIFIILICEILKYLCKYDELFYACTMHALLNMFFLLLINPLGYLKDREFHTVYTCFLHNISFFFLKMSCSIFNAINTIFCFLSITLTSTLLFKLFLSRQTWTLSLLTSCTSDSPYAGNTLFFHWVFLPIHNMCALNVFPDCIVFTE